MMELGMPLSEVNLADVYPEKRLLSFPFETLDDLDQVRVFYKVEEDEGCGFWFGVYEWMSGGDGKGYWDPETCCVVRVAHGHALFDGVRHVWIGGEEDEDESPGYLNYPNLAVWAKLIAWLQRMVTERCSNPCNGPLPTAPDSAG